MTDFNDTHYIFTYGLKGHGKSTFLIGILAYLSGMSEEYKLVFDPNNTRGLELVATLVRFYEKNRFPPISLMNEIGEVNVEIKSRTTGEVKKFTFLEMSGEDLQNILIDSEISRRIKHYLSETYLISILILVSIDKIEKGDLISMNHPITEFDTVLNYEQTGISKIGVILSKADKSDEYNKFKGDSTKNNEQRKYTEKIMKRLIRAKHMMKDNGSNPSVFPYSICNSTNKDSSGEELMEGKEESLIYYCPPIVDFLFDKVEKSNVKKLKKGNSNFENFKIYSELLGRFFKGVTGS